MNRRLGIAITAVGAVLLVIGVILGFTPTSSGDYFSSDTIGCGSAFAPALDEAKSRDNSNAMNSDLNSVRIAVGLEEEFTFRTNFEEGCERASSKREIPAYMLVGVGVVTVLAGILIATRTPATQRAA